MKLKKHGKFWYLISQFDELTPSQKHQAIVMLTSQHNAQASLSAIEMEIDRDRPALTVIARVRSSGAITAVFSATGARCVNESSTPPPARPCRDCIARSGGWISPARCRAARRSSRQRNTTTSRPHHTQLAASVCADCTSVFRSSERSRRDG